MRLTHVGQLAMLRGMTGASCGAPKAMRARQSSRAGWNRAGAVPPTTFNGDAECAAGEIVRLQPDTTSSPA
jgi:hypothetical protein